MKLSDFCWITLAITAITGSLFSETASSAEAPTYEKPVVQMPISWSSPTQCNLAVAIPPEYRSIQPMSLWEDSPIIEFVPEKDDDNNWSEIITLNKFVGRRISAAQITSHLEKTLPTKSTNFKVLDSSVSKEPLYLLANLAVSYDNEGRHEVLYCRYYSGPYDCAGIQYTVRPKEGQTDEEVVKKIESFFDAAVQTVDCEEAAYARL